MTPPVGKMAKVEKLSLEMALPPTIVKKKILTDIVVEKNFEVPVLIKVFRTTMHHELYMLLYMLWGPLGTVDYSLVNGMVCNNDSSWLIA